MVNLTRFSPLLALLALHGVGSAGDQDVITTAPIYLPYYDKDSWSLMRGSVIASDSEAHQTSYTIFCPDDDPPECDISLEFPFVVVEGPDTVIFHGTYTSTYIANLECSLKGTTAAICSGYSSFKDGYTNGPYAGPTEVSWTSTYTGIDVDWGVLTMAEVPKETGDEWDVTATAQTTPASGSGLDAPLETESEASGVALRVEVRSLLLFALASAILIVVLF